MPINTNDILNTVINNINYNSINNKNDVAENENFIPFKDMFEDAIKNVTETNATVQTDIIKLVTGETDDLHTLTINLAKADLAIQTLVQVRNKALDAYNEIMRITL
ncbi:MAG: flagellar hook-basal body complex protein FliE [Clostridia bacterium]|nr:flagellar hook-basal body complex protein FliE [Clostridia bacterium]